MSCSQMRGLGLVFPRLETHNERRAAQLCGLQMPPRSINATGYHKMCNTDLLNERLGQT